MSLLSATVKTTVKANQADAFEYIVPIDLTSIFKGYGPLPSVTGTQNQVGAWDTAGSSRDTCKIVQDGSESLTENVIRNFVFKT
jgi:hypothetical protein